MTYEELIKGEKRLHRDIAQIAKRFLDAYNPYSSKGVLELSFERFFSGTPKSLGVDDIWRFSNTLMVHHYHNEAFVKYRLIQSELSKSKAVSAFEIPVGDSRADLCRVNGHSYCYEIKTAFDKLDRLEKQLEDYLSVFEFVYVVCPDERVMEILPTLPKEVGIISYDDHRTNPGFITRKKASLSSSICPEKQIQALSLPLDKTKGAAGINSLFKAKFKTKYQENWKFLVGHMNDLLPLDYQWAFKNKLLPLRR